jgi:hypothetical protein
MPEDSKLSALMPGGAAATLPTVLRCDCGKHVAQQRQAERQQGGWVWVSRGIILTNPQAAA